MGREGKSCLTSPLTSPVYAYTDPFPNREFEHFEGITFSFIFVLLILIVFLLNKVYDAIENIYGDY